MEKADKLYNLLIELYYFLRDEGLSVHAQSVKRLLVLLKNNDIRGLKKEIRSNKIILGGSGSIRDLSFMNTKKDLFFTNILKTIIELIGKRI